MVQSELEDVPVAEYVFLLVVSIYISPTFNGVVAGAAVPVLTDGAEVQAEPS